MVPNQAGKKGGAHSTSRCFAWWACRPPYPSHRGTVGAGGGRGMKWRRVPRQNSALRSAHPGECRDAAGEGGAGGLSRRAEGPYRRGAVLTKLSGQLTRWEGAPRGQWSGVRQAGSGQRPHGRVEVEFHIRSQLIDVVSPSILHSQKAVEYHRDKYGPFPSWLGCNKRTELSNVGEYKSHTQRKQIKSHSSCF